MSDETRAEQTTGEGQLRRDIGLIPLLFASLGSIIGSGWLFGALYASNEAGPAAMFSWIFGALVVIILALNFAELGGMLPVSGVTVRSPHFAFGTLVGFTWGWITFVGSVAIIPIEAQAVIQYASNYIDGLVESTTAAGAVILAPLGILIAIVLVAIFTVVNLLGIKSFAKTNTTLTSFKIVVPVLTIIALMIAAFNTSNFSAGGGFAPTGIKGVLTAISAAGVFFAMFGFEQAATLGGESSNPRRNIPIAVIGSVLIGVVIYFLLQVAFIGAVNPNDLSKGWDELAFAGSAGPFAGLATGVGLAWLAGLLYVDAAVSPGGTGLVYTTTSSRILYGLSRNRYIPRVFGEANQRGVPVWSVVFCFFAACIFFLPFKGWAQLVVFITSAYALVYAAGPLAVGAMRRRDPDRKRPYSLPIASVLAPLAFVAANYVVYFAGWVTNQKVFMAIIAGFVVLLITQVFSGREDRPSLDWQASVWMWPFFIGLALLSYLGSFEGENIIKFPLDLVVVAVFALAIYFLAMRFALPADRVEEYLERTREEVQGSPEEKGAPGARRA
jgi:amino acid transporter